MRSLNEIVEALPESVIATTEIDLSSHLGEPAGTTVFTFREPGMAQLFQAQKDAPKLSARYPDFPTEMCATIALLALSHVSPPVDGPRGIVYANLAQKDNHLFLWLTARVMEAFPRLSDLDAAIAVEKKVSSADSPAP